LNAETHYNLTEIVKPIEPVVDLSAKQAESKLEKAKLEKAKLN
jgi:hypothetical protein